MKLFSCIFLFVVLACPVLVSAQSASRFEVTGATIAETQAAIREGRTTCRVVCESYLARIKAYDQTPLGPERLRLNAIVLVNPNALAEADACDRNFAATHKLPPLGGIAVLIKDNYDTAGLQTTGGSLAMKGFVPERDAPMVAKLRAAGAIVLAKTNMAEWAFSPYLTASSIAGITRNPYDLDAGAVKGFEWWDGGGGCGEPGRGWAGDGYGELDSRAFVAQRSGWDSADDWV